MHVRDRLSSRSPKDLIADRVKNPPANAGLFVNAEEGKAVVRIYDVIGWPFIEAQDVAAALDGITADEIEVQINSPGGDAFEGVAIFNALRAHPAKITTRVDGIAASAASIVVQAGDHRIMLTGSQMMIHDAWGLAIGNADVMRETGDVLDKVSATLAGIYEERSGREGMRDLMLAESWFTHDEAVDAGLADEVVKPTRQARAEAHESFTDRMDSAIAGVEAVVEEIGTVSESRSSQGKPPISDDTRERVERIRAALSEFVDVSDEPEKQDTPELSGLAAQRLSELDKVDAENLDFTKEGL